MTGFHEKLKARRSATGAVLCVGLDPDMEKMPPTITSGPEPLYEFCRRIVAATTPFAAAFKPNLAFFEAQGASGIAQLERVLGEIPSDIPVILDGKRGDIGNTARLYARFLFEALNGDAATVNPYLGRDSLEPLFAYPGKIPFVLCLTSNPGSADIQTLVVDPRQGAVGGGEERVYQRVIVLLQRIQGASDRGPAFGLVVGARHTTLLEDVRRLAPSAPLLIPGIGAQGGDLAATVRIASANGAPALINVSRDILYASNGDDFAEAAAEKARWYAAEMKKHLGDTKSL